MNQSNEIQLPKTPSDFYEYFLGTWEIQRTVHYRYGGGQGEMSGKAVFKPWYNSTLFYEERGTLCLKGNPSLHAFRTYAYEFCQEALHLHFILQNDPPELKPFCTLHFDESGFASTDHLCRKDRYKGQFQCLTTTSFSTEWRIYGPNKDGQIKTHYEKMTQSRNARSVASV